mgnify:FL=1
MLRALQKKVKKEKPGMRVLAEMLKALKQRVKHNVAARALALVVTALRVRRAAWKTMLEKPGTPALATPTRAKGAPTPPGSAAGQGAARSSVMLAGFPEVPQIEEELVWLAKADDKVVRKLVPRWLKAMSMPHSAKKAETLRRRWTAVLEEQSSS